MLEAENNEHLIRYKKDVYPISDSFLSYLKNNNRYVKIPLAYNDLLRFQDGIPILDEEGENTLWLNVYYSHYEREEINNQLKQIYSILHVDGSDEVIPFLNVDSIDFCTFGNTKPFRVKVRNVLNDNYVYLYIKKADASRVYGLELEDILSPNQINFLVHEDTLIEEHILGIPGDVFIEEFLPQCSDIEKSALAKQFVKFNERCFVRLLGDMRAYNYVVVITHDFDRIQYRFRAIDFDQQSFEGELDIYAPQSFEENKPFYDLTKNLLSEGAIEQYKKEERALISKRAKSNINRLQNLLECMKGDVLSTEKNVKELKMHLYHLTKDVNFKKSTSMGEILESVIDFVLRNYETLNHYLVRNK